MPTPLSCSTWFQINCPQGHDECISMGQMMFDCLCKQLPVPVFQRSLSGYQPETPNLVAFEVKMRCGWEGNHALDSWEKNALSTRHGQFIRRRAFDHGTVRACQTDFFWCSRSVRSDRCFIVYSYGCVWGNNLWDVIATVTRYRYGPFISILD